MFWFTPVDSAVFSNRFKLMPFHLRFWNEFFLSGSKEYIAGVRELTSRFSGKKMCLKFIFLYVCEI